MTNGDIMAETLSEAQVGRLRALLDTILPASGDGRMPSAADLDFLSYLGEQARDFLPALAQIVDDLAGDFGGRPLAQRVELIEDFSRRDPDAFAGLLMRVYDCYYQDDRVRELIGARPVPPFPRGNTIPAGDLSGLDSVAARGKRYRR